MGGKEKEDYGLIKPGKENTQLSSFYQDNKSSIDQVAEQAKEELYLRSPDNGNYHFVEQFVADFPTNLKAALIRSYAHLPVHLDGLSGALAFYTDVYQQHKEAMEEIKNYYVDLRNKGATTEDEIKPIPISARQLEALIRVAEASAKIRLSKKVLKKDAKLAISLIHFCLMQVGFDKETGQIDIDRISTGITASQRNKFIVIKEIITKLEVKTGSKTIPLEDISVEASEKGITEDQLEETIEKLKRSGDIFEPKKGFIQKI